jgi:hypothetical protein
MPLDGTGPVFLGALCRCQAALNPRGVAESWDSECLFCRGRRTAILHILDQWWVSFPVKNVIDALSSSRLQGLKIHQVSSIVTGPYMFAFTFVVAEAL